MTIFVLRVEGLQASVGSTTFPGDGSVGGAILNSGGALNIYRTRFVRNQAADGGGIAIVPQHPHRQSPTSAPRLAHIRTGTRPNLHRN
jgi:hypothetical protein